MSGNEIEAFTEGAKAAQELAKLGERAVDAGREAGGWLNRIFGQGIEDAVALHWSDRVKARRIEAAIFDWERLTVLLHKCEGRLRSKGVTVFRSIPPKIALPLLENATVEDNDDLHTLWANLLATGLDAAADEIHRKYTTILSELTSQDARILAAFHTVWRTPLDKWPRSGAIRYWPSDSSGIPYDECAVVTLNRLGLIAPEIVEFATYDPPHQPTLDNRQGHYVPGDLTELKFTPLGEAFCAAVL
jgi:hypothetical protein